MSSRDGRRSRSRQLGRRHRRFATLPMGVRPMPGRSGYRRRHPPERSITGSSDNRLWWSTGKPCSNTIGVPTPRSTTFMVPVNSIAGVSSLVTGFKSSVGRSPASPCAALTPDHEPPVGWSGSGQRAGARGTAKPAPPRHTLRFSRSIDRPDYRAEYRRRRPESADCDPTDAGDSGPHAWKTRRSSGGSERRSTEMHYAFGSVTAE